MKSISDKDVLVYFESGAGGAGSSPYLNQKVKYHQPKITPTQSEQTPDVPVDPPKPVIDPIESVIARNQLSLGLKNDGTVIGAGANSQEQITVSSWADIIQIAAGTVHSVGLKKDGTCVGTGSTLYNQADVSSWTGIKKIAADWYHTVAVKSDGITGISKIAVGDNHIVILANGVVTCKGANYSNQSSFTGETDVVDIAATEDMTIIVKADGTVKYDGYNNGFNFNAIRSWTNIVKSMPVFLTS